MRLVFPVIGVLVLAACDPAVPDSAAGVGFSDYSSYMREREAQMRSQQNAQQQQLPVLGESSAQAGQPLSVIPGLSSGAPDASGDPSAQAIAQEAVAALGSGTRVGATPPPASGQQATWQQGTTFQQGSGISEQTFNPDARPEQIETEAERQARMAAQYEMVQPGALPERPADTTNIVAYALSTTNRVGQQIHRRSSLTLQNHDRNCAQFASQDLAQEEFLRRGGPDRDPMNLDPNGDGFACWWDPEPFRAAARAASSGG